MTVKINIYGAAGSGKSLTAALAYAEFKIQGCSAELIREYAKELAWSGFNMKHLKPYKELVILANQVEREKALEGKVDVIITDSPLLINAFYSGNPHAREIALSFSQEGSLHFWVTREGRYEAFGRSQTQEEADRDAPLQHRFLTDLKIPLIEVKGPIRDRGVFIYRCYLEFIKTDAASYQPYLLV